MAGMCKGRETNTLVCVCTQRGEQMERLLLLLFIQSGYPHVGVRQGQIDVERVVRISGTMMTGNLENVSFVEVIEKERGHERRTGCGCDSWCIRSRGYGTRDG